MPVVLDLEDRRDRGLNSRMTTRKPRTEVTDAVLRLTIWWTIATSYELPHP